MQPASKFGADLVNNRRTLTDNAVRTAKAKSVKSSGKQTRPARGARADYTAQGPNEG
jgi:hypothetical protein